jgi:hypothetical protein
VSYLEYVLGKVRESDLDRFRKKVEPDEKERDQLVHDQGLEHIDDIVRRKSDTMLESSSMKVNDSGSFTSDQPINVQTEKTEKSDEKTSEDVFAKFLQTIRG